jgi:hypothetical protein
MTDSILVKVTARPDGRGDPFLRIPPIDGGPFLLRLGVGMEVISRRLKSARSYVDEVGFDVDFSLIEEVWKERGRFGDSPHKLSIWDFSHPTWSHFGGRTICSNCMVQEPEEIGPELDAEIEDSLDDQVTLHPAASYPEELAEDLQDAVPGMTIEQHDECANCGRDFILNEAQVAAIDSGEMELGEFACDGCRDVTGR